MSERLDRDFLDQWGPRAHKLEFQGRRISTLGENDLRALLAYEAHRDAALNAALSEQTKKLNVLTGCTVNMGGVRGWLMRTVIGRAALAKIRKAGVATK